MATTTTTQRKRSPGERPPICFRPGDLRTELDARSDGTEAGYRATVVRDLARLYALYNHYAVTIQPDMARGLLLGAKEMPPNSDALWLACVQDALERAKILVDHAGMSVDAALVVVGLVADGGE